MDVRVPVSFALYMEINKMTHQANHSCCYQNDRVPLIHRSSLKEAMGGSPGELSEELVTLENR